MDIDPIWQAQILGLMVSILEVMNLRYNRNSF